MVNLFDIDHSNIVMKSYGQLTIYTSFCILFSFSFPFLVMFVFILLLTHIIRFPLLISPSFISVTLTATLYTRLNFLMQRASCSALLCRVC